MIQGVPQYPKLKCPKKGCSQATAIGPSSEGPDVRRFVRKGYYYRTHDSRTIPRFQCKSCGIKFSSATLSPRYRQKKRKANEWVRVLLCSSVSQRRIALILGINIKTVERKFIFLAQQAKLAREVYLQSLRDSGASLTHVQFDEMETFEKSKCLPLSVPILVENSTRKILGFRVAIMPSNGPLAKISKTKYGPRPDERRQAGLSLLAEMVTLLPEEVKFSSDEKSAYPNWIRAYFPKAVHVRYKGSRGCSTGQGELKRIGFDPLFSFNHTAAMVRANVNRLVRKTWCTTKRRDRLVCHLEIYAQFHNETLTKRVV